MGSKQRPRFASKLAIVIVVCFGALVIGASAAVRGGWRVVPVAPPHGIAAPGPVGEIFGNMACVSKSDCWSAGTGESRTGANVSFMEHWTGSRFKLVRSPSRAAFLQGLDCVSAKDCWVAGGRGRQDPTFGQISRYKPLIAHWNGRRWATVAVPNPRGVSNQLSDVSCRSRSDCYAVGWTGTAKRERTLIERFDGRRWSVVSNSAPRGQAFAYLDGIDCVSKSLCIAVGAEQRGASTASHVFAERGSGRRWRVLSMPDYPAPNSASALYGLSCTSARFCMATGSAFYFPAGGYNPGVAMAERWNGRRWSLIKPSLPETGKLVGAVIRLADVSCVSSRVCWAVGATPGISGHSPAVTAFWNGSRFTLGRNANPAAHSELDADYCLRASDCLALGFALNRRSTPYPIAERLR